MRKSTKTAVIAGAVLFGCLYAEAQPEEVVHAPRTKLLEPEFVGHNIPERNIPFERMLEIKQEMKERKAEIEAEQERKRQEELERLERERVAREQAEAERKAQEERQALQRATEEPSQAGGAVGEFTAYYPYNDAMQGGGLTATGHNLYESIYYQGMRVLASDSSIPFYSIVEFTVEGYGTMRGIVLDRGGRIKGNKFDIAFPDRSSCMEFGRRKGTYKIIRYGKGE